MKFSIHDTFNRELPADALTENYTRQVTGACYSFVNPTPCKSPKLLHASPEMLQAVGLSAEDAQSDDFLKIFSGTSIYPQTQPYAMCYGGHQFGTWAGQLGDGRAINLFEVFHAAKRWALQLKGAGKTPYSRSADGLAVLRSSIREYLCSEAMFHLGVPTTRALSLILSGEEVLRDILYNGNPQLEKGAIVCRVAPSFIRFGNFQIFAARKDLENLQRLTDYTLRHFYAHLGQPSIETYIAFFEEVMQKNLEMVVHWERVGFVHGVMNTDNMSILGLTIDYGPYGWVEDFDPMWTPNTTDAQFRRYRFGNQAQIAFWNLLQLGNALFPLIQVAKPLEDILQSFESTYLQKQQAMYFTKLGLKNVPQASDFLADLHELMYQSQIDFTLFFRKLADFNPKYSVDFLQVLPELSYATDLKPFEEAWQKWLEEYAHLIVQSGLENRKSVMESVNPKYILRNYMAQLAIDAAEVGDYGLINELFDMLKNPYTMQPQMEKWFCKRPDWAKYKVGCAMLSCSS